MSTPEVFETAKPEEVNNGSRIQDNKLIENTFSMEPSTVYKERKGNTMTMKSDMPRLETEQYDKTRNHTTPLPKWLEG